MDLFQIWTTHNRPWSVREIVVFLILLSVCSFYLFRAVCEKRLKLQQGAAILALLVFLGIVFASTVFTRTATVRRYELVPFWSWYEVIVNHSRSLLIENLLNVILLFPVGILLPVILDSRLRPFMVYLTGVIISAVIEISQLLFKRGLFEWDDMIHNGFGCMLGCLVVNAVMKACRRKQEYFVRLKIVPQGRRKKKRSEALMKKRYYIAYGSNLSTRQMAYRTPDAKIVGTAVLTGWQLLFKVHATIEENPKKNTPVLVWEISEEDEKQLDRYEGYPVYYYKRELPVEVFPISGGEPVQLNAMVYIMADGHELQSPMPDYYRVLEQGYKDFHFPMHILEQALADSVG